jgi:putative oxidoreductase
MPPRKGSAMRVLYVVGRVLFALIFIVAAPRHFTAEGIGHAAELGVPFAAVPLSGLMALAGGFSVASGYRTVWGAGCWSRF